jgi:hypothetical protein
VAERDNPPLRAAGMTAVRMTTSPPEIGLRSRSPRARGDVVSTTGPIPRVTLTRSEAAQALDMSLDSFERHVQPELRLIRRRKLRLVPIVELERWAESAAERTARRAG